MFLWILLLESFVIGTGSILVESDSHQETLRKVAHLVVPNSLLSNAPENILFASKIVGQATVAVAGNGELEDISSKLDQMLRDYTQSGSELLTKEKQLFNATAELLGSRANTHKENIEKRLSYLRLQSSYINKQVQSLGQNQKKKIRKRSIDIVRRQNQHLTSRVSDLHSTVDTGFVETQREIRKSALKMAIQVQKLREDSNEANQEVKATLEELDSRLLHIDNSLAHFQTETLESLAELSKEMGSNADKLLNNIENLSWTIDENFADQAQLIAESSEVLINRIDHLSGHMDHKFSQLDQSISDTAARVTERIDAMHQELKTQLGQLADGVMGIRTDLAAFNRLFVARMDKLQNSVNKVQQTLDQYKLKSHIDDIKGLVNAWIGLMKTVVGELSGELSDIKAARFKHLCIRHDPLSVLTWIQRNIYDTVRGSVTRVAAENFAEWQAGVVTLRNSAFVMYSACIHSQTVSHQVIDVELMHRFEQFLADNFLQTANSVQELHYAQWWRKHIGAISTAGKRRLKSELETHKEWIQFDIQIKEKVTVMNVTSSANPTPSVTQLIQQKHSELPQQDLFFCCELAYEVCHQRSQQTKHHVCFGKIVLIKTYPSGPTYLIHMWPTSSALPIQSTDNFFTAPNGVGFVVTDMAQYGSTWSRVQDIVNIHTDSQEKWDWQVILTDNICWWKQEGSSDCTDNQCDWQTNTQIAGPIMKLVAVENKDMCCAMCAGTSGCLAVSWRSPDMCVLYDRFNRVVKKDGWMTASKMKDCTQCTNSLDSDDCANDFDLDDRVATNAQFESHMNVSSLDCAQRCMRAAPLCTSYSWYLTKDGSFCQLNDQQAVMENRIGSTIHYAPTTEEQCRNLKGVCPNESPCKNDALCVDWFDGANFTCICNRGWKGSDCSLEDNCQAGPWTTTSACSVSCGGGQQTLSRAVVSQSTPNGIPCPALSLIVPCNTEPCPSVTDCQTSQWSDYGPCSSECGGGNQNRTRMVTVEATGGGKACPVLIESQQCNTQSCDDCTVSDWSISQACSASCGGGVQTITRSVLQQSSGTGRPCPDFVATLPCNTEPCPIVTDCEVSEWSVSQPCSASCGGGVQTVTRTVIKVAAGAGKVCPPLTDTVPCNNQPCDSRILLIGGWLKGRSAQNSLELYYPTNPSLNHVLKPSLTQGRYDHSSARLSDGTVITVGGQENSDFFSSCERYSPAENQVTDCTSLPGPRAYAGAAVVDGVMHLCGGRSDKSLIELDSCLMFVDGHWYWSVSMNTKRGEVALVALDHHLYAIGGMATESEGPLATAERYSSATNKWSSIASMGTARRAPSAAVLGSAIHVCGGLHGDTHLSSCERYDAVRDTWTVILAMRKPRYHFTMVAIDGGLLAIGGSKYPRSVEKYDDQLQKWQEVGELTETRDAHTAVVLM